VERGRARLGRGHSLDPPFASHLYALLSIAQHRALAQGGEAAVAGASAAVLRRFFPHAASIGARAAAQEERARGTPAEAVAREASAGRIVAARLLESAEMNSACFATLLHCRSARRIAHLGSH
jgi:hypothetical protein